MSETGEPFRPQTRVALEAVKRALTIARRGVGADDVTVKDGRDLVTATDVAVEDAIRSVVADASGIPVVGEERGGEAAADGSPTGSSIPSAGPAHEQLRELTPPTERNLP